jgi:hypothetical protein
VPTCHHAKTVPAAASQAHGQADLMKTLRLCGANRAVRGLRVSGSLMRAMRGGAT